LPGISGPVTNCYTQDLVAPRSQILQTNHGGTTSNYLYGLDQLAASSGSMRTWYQRDALVRLLLATACTAPVRTIPSVPPQTPVTAPTGNPVLATIDLEALVIQQGDLAPCRAQSKKCSRSERRGRKPRVRVTILDARENVA